MDITVGRTVLYTLSEQDAIEINRRRTNGGSIYDRMHQEPPAWPAGAQAHIGNDARVGQVFPAVATRIWGPTATNFTVFLDGSDTYWATSRSEGTEPGTWAWPARV